MANTGRNKPCPCGKTNAEGVRLKYKRCCGAPSPQAEPKSQDTSSRRRLPPELMRKAQQKFREMQSNEHVRQQQQGGGHPIIAENFQGHRIVAVGNKLFIEKPGGTFVDFLLKYLVTHLDKDWCDAELKKPYNERHTLLQWHEDVARYQISMGAGSGKVVNADMNGAVAAYLGLAHAMYRLEHNASIQARLLNHLKTPDLFQGAYYEAMVASIFVTANFTLEQEDETDGTTKHCEFVARSSTTATTYHVEAKTRAVAGIMGKGPNDGAKDDSDPTAKVVTHVAAALKKPAAGQRFIFVDLNAILPPDALWEKKPKFIEAAVAKLKRYESTNMPKGATAYVFLTASSFHRDLDGPARMITYMHGLGMPDFNKDGSMRLAERHKQERPHRDALAIADAVKQFLKVPTTFDGSLPSETYCGHVRPLVGYMYNFVQPPAQPLNVTVLAGSVDEQAKKMTLHVVTREGERVTIVNDMTDDQLHDYRAHRENFFGGDAPQRTYAQSPEDIFEWALRANANTSCEALLDAMKAMPNIEAIHAMSEDDVRAEHAEWVTRVLLTRQQLTKKNIT